MVVGVSEPFRMRPVKLRRNTITRARGRHGELVSLPQVAAIGISRDRGTRQLATGFYFQLPVCSVQILQTKITRHAV
jgi:hypothetical protein